MDEDNASVTEDMQTESSTKKVRHRKKQLYRTILQQMEFYFGDANITKDRFMGKLIEKDKYIDLAVFLRFNKIRCLTSNVEDIAKALQKSKLLSVSDDGTKVCRTTPIRQKENEDECTIYVEQLPPDAHHEWLKGVFSSYGKVAYVSIPKYKSGKIKGFAFVEFDTPETANNTLEAFGDMGCCLPTQMPPEQLCSIATFESEKQEETNTKDEVTSDFKEETESVAVESEEPESGHSKSEKNSKKKRKEDKEGSVNEDVDIKPSNIKENTESIPISEKVDSENSVKKKRKGDRDNTSKTDEVQPQTVEQVDEFLTKRARKRRGICENDPDDPDMTTEKPKRKKECDEEVESEELGTGHSKSEKSSKKKRKEEKEGSVNEDVDIKPSNIKENTESIPISEKVDSESTSKTDEVEPKTVDQVVEFLTKRARKRRGICENDPDDPDMTTEKPKRKKESDEEDCAKISKTDDQENEIEEDMEAADQGDGVDDDDVFKKKKNRKHKSKMRKEKQDLMESSKIGLKILSKREWKRLRNKYLELQRSKMKALKQQLNRARWGSSYHPQPWRDAMPHGARNDDNTQEQMVDNDNEVKSAPRTTFTPGVIIHVQLDDAVSDVKKFKVDARVNPDIQYIDLQEGGSEAYVRCSSAEAAEKLVLGKPWQQMSVLTGESETAYWEKIKSDREEKLGKKVRVKQRGRPELLKKAERELGKHIRFDE